VGNEVLTPATVDTSRAHPARLYDYYLRGKDNYPVDRAAARKVIAASPQARKLALANRGFLVRVVQFLAEQGIRQFLDLGTGIPTSPNVHEVARQVTPGATVVYVDNDPVVTRHSQALRATHDAYRDAAAPLVPRTAGEITSLFSGWELADPGRLVDVSQWHPGKRAMPTKIHILAGVGRKPGDPSRDHRGPGFIPSGRSAWR